MCVQITLANGKTGGKPENGLEKVEWLEETMWCVRKAAKPDSGMVRRKWGEVLLESKSAITTKRALRPKRGHNKEMIRYDNDPIDPLSRSSHYR
jgi:hypothetical protein